MIPYCQFVNELKKFSIFHFNLYNLYFGVVVPWISNFLYNIFGVQSDIALIYSQVYILEVVLNIFENLSLKLFLVVLIYINLDNIRLAYFFYISG